MLDYRNHPPYQVDLGELAFNDNRDCLSDFSANIRMFFQSHPACQGYEFPDSLDPQNIVL